MPDPWPGIAAPDCNDCSWSWREGIRQVKYLSSACIVHRPYGPQPPRETTAVPAGEQPGLREARVRADRILAGHLDGAGNMVSGLALEDIGEDGHALANRLWRVAGYLRRRGGGTPGRRPAPG